MNDQPEDPVDRRIAYMCAMIKQLGADNGSGREYFTALTLCVGHYLRGIPDVSMRMTTLHQFLQAIRHFVLGAKRDAN